MDNTHQSPGGGEDASRPTEQFWSGPRAAGQPGAGPAAGGAASGQPGPGYPQPGSGYRQPWAGGQAPDGTAFGQPGPGYGQPWGDGPAYYQQPGQEPPGRGPRDRHRRLRWSAGIAAAVLLAGGGAILGVSLAGNSSPGSALAAASSPASTSQAPASGDAAQGAVLSAALSAADSPAAPGSLDSTGALATSAPASNSPAGNPSLARRCAAARAAVAGHPAAVARVRHACRLRFIVRALALRGVHGEFTVRGKNGFRVLAFERGTIQSVSSGQDVVIRAPDGTTWTWKLVSSTVVRESRHKTGTSALAQGQQVWAGGPVSAGVRDARLIVIRPPSAAPAPAASPSAS